MRAALGDRIARFKVPAHLRIVDELPLTPSGKVRKFRLREMFTAEQQAGSTGTGGRSHGQ
jgi:acyl-CoA synthetase (AMP-forming)/AMP-acid ligase II